MKVKELLFVITLKDIRMKSLKKTSERLVIVTENILRMIALLIIVLLEEVMREGGGRGVSGSVPATHYPTQNPSTLTNDNF